MGTNFYGRKQVRFLQSFSIINVEELVDSPRIHLGKKSCGWSFLAQWNEGKYYKNKEEYLKFIENLEIFDEYGNWVDFQEFADIVNNGKDKSQEYSSCNELEKAVFDKKAELKFIDGDWC